MNVLLLLADFEIPPLAIYAVAAIVLIAMILGGMAILIARFYRKVNQGQALIVNNMRKEPTVTFTGATVLPIIHRAEVMEISLKTIELERRGKEGLICKDNIRADIKVTFFVRVNKTAEDVLKVAQAIGTNRASHQETLEELFNAKFSEALKTVGKVLDFEELYTRRHDFKEQILEVIGEAANALGVETTDEYPEVNWRDITRLRIVLAHHYQRVDSEQVWNIAVAEVPALLLAISPGEIPG